MDFERMSSLPRWPALVRPLVEICQEAQDERAIPAETMALAMIAAGWQVVAQINGPAAAAVALLAALDALRAESPEDVAVAESARRKHEGDLH